MNIRTATSAGLALGLGAIVSAWGQVPPASEPAIPPGPPASGARPNVPAPAAGYGAPASEYRVFVSGRAEGGQPTVLLFSSATASAVQEMEEDLTVMGRLLDRSLQALGPENSPYRGGTPLYYTVAGRSAQGQFLEGFGALFTFKVGFPLLPPAKPQEVKPAKPVDTEWERARREVLGQGQPDNPFGPGMGTPPVPYDPAQVETLKKLLTQSLKSATNIRHIKPEEWVGIAVVGASIAPGNAARTVETSTVRTTSRLTLSEPLGLAVPEPPPGGGPPAAGVADRLLPPGAVPAGPRNVIVRDTGTGQGSRCTLLTMRAKKADIDALAAGKITEEDFQATLSVQTYVGGTTGGGQSFSGFTPTPLTPPRMKER